MYICMEDILNKLIFCFFFILFYLFLQEHKHKLSVNWRIQYISLSKRLNQHTTELNSPLSFTLKFTWRPQKGAQVVGRETPQ